MPLVILLPQKTRREGDFCVIELPLHYESKEPSEGQRGERRANSEKEDAKKQQ